MIPLLISAIAAALLIPRAHAPLAPPAPLCAEELPARLTAPHIFHLALQAGFPLPVAQRMTQIAMRESDGDPRAVNFRGDDYSWGLWQINVRKRIWLEWLGLSHPEQLLNPVINARAAHKLWSAYGMKPWDKR